MLTPLAINMLIMLITCALILLICWVFDTDRAEIEAGHSHPAPETATKSASAYRVGRAARREAHEFLDQWRSDGPAMLDPGDEIAVESMVSCDLGSSLIDRPTLAHHYQCAFVRESQVRRRREP